MPLLLENGQPSTYPFSILRRMVTSGGVVEQPIEPSVGLVESPMMLCGIVRLISSFTPFFLCQFNLQREITWKILLAIIAKCVLAIMEGVLFGFTILCWGIYEQNSIVIWCPWEWLANRFSDHCLWFSLLGITQIWWQLMVLNADFSSWVHYTKNFK